MGLTKQYLRYSPSSKFNIIASNNSNVEFVTLQNQEGRFVAVGGCEDVIIWDLRLAEKALVLPGDKQVVTCVASSPNRNDFAAGYENGSVSIFNLKTAENTTTFSGHRSAITCLAYDKEGHRLASGSKDTEIIIWDIVAETGLHRLSGHKGVITKVGFLHEHNILISSSKDTLVKFWDLDTAHCFKTIVAHRTEVWDFTLIKEGKYLVTGCTDNELRVWKISPVDAAETNDIVEESEIIIADENSETNTKGPVNCQKAGSFLRTGRGRVVSITTDPTGRVLACHSLENTVELYVFLSESEINERFKKRQRKMRKKALKKCEEGKGVEEEKGGEVEQMTIDTCVPSLIDEVQRLCPIKTSSKVKSISVLTGRGGEVRVATSLNNNILELYMLPELVKDVEHKCLRKIYTQGHHSEVKSLCFSSDNLAVVSASGESVKMWNRVSLTCLRTVEVNHVTSLCFVPGDRHVLVGKQDGHFLIIDIAAGDILGDISAHSSEITSVVVTPNQHGCVSGSKDKLVKMWNFELIDDPSGNSKAKILSVKHKRTLELDEGVLVVRITPNNKLLAVSLLDCTVKIFFMDSLKFFFSLYSHKLPIICMDISYDSTLIATGSADRNMKIWGLDFGDCHRSIFAHDDSIMGLQFVPKTHYIFTCGKDGKVKQWDADSYDKILTLEGHYGNAWTLAVSPDGQYVVSSGSDKVLRVFERTMEPLVLEDEAEEEREAEENEKIATGEQTVVPGIVDLNLPSKKTVGSEKVAEQLLECLEIGKDYKLKLLEHAEFCKETGTAHPAPPPPVLMQAYKAKTPEEYLLEVLSRIRSSDLEEALLLLPFSAVCELLSQLPKLINQSSHTELISRVMIFLIRIHNGPIVNNKSLLPVITELQKLSLTKVNELRDVVGYNLHALKFLQHQIEEKEGVQLFREAFLDKRDKDRRRKKRQRTINRVVI